MMMLRPTSTTLRSLVIACMVAFTGAVAAPVAAVEREPIDFDHVAAMDELTDDHARVLRLYWAAFDRTPDPGGALFWIDRLERCQSLVSIARFFAASDEFLATYGELDDAGFVDVIYRNVLDRASDSGGAAFWLDELASGKMTRAEVLLHFSWSDEFVGSLPLPSDGVPGRPCIDHSPTGSERARTFQLQSWEPFATVGGIDLHQPASVVELIGFHESNNDGGRQMAAADTITDIVTLDSRNRGTFSRSAADVVVHPLSEIRSPVTGTVVRAGGYTLYCDYRDDYAVIEPDAQPGWEVKVLHIDGVQVSRGDRVEAGITVLAPRARPLPFSSQIDRLTGQPAWPHVHIEVVDPSIPDRPGRGC